MVLLARLLGLLPLTFHEPGRNGCNLCAVVAAMVGVDLVAGSEEAARV